MPAKLLDTGLRYGNLVHLTSKALVRRYKSALERLTGKTTDMEDFHVDISGFSPEIATVLGRDYLNHNGCNRQFILVTMDQLGAPLLEARFSVSKTILSRFFEENKGRLEYILGHDALCGEIENSVFQIEKPEDLLAVDEVFMVYETATGLFAKSKELLGKVEEFESDPEKAFDGSFLSSMLDLSRQTGDVTRHPFELTGDEIHAPNYWTDHFGGVYLFRKVNGKDIPETFIPVQDDAIDADAFEYRLLPFSNRAGIGRFLKKNKLVEEIVDISEAKARRILTMKRDFLIIGAAADQGIFEGIIHDNQIRSLEKALGENAPKALEAIDAALAYLDGNGPRPDLSAEHPGYFYLLRGAKGLTKSLVNMLLAELCPFDAQKLFIFHKAAFYAAYSTWPEAKQEFVAEFLVRSYVKNKVGLRSELFGEDVPFTGKEIS